jgi:tRNA A-37 threonylcarbamoyl transferase component Bud32
MWNPRVLTWMVQRVSGGFSTGFKLSIGAALSLVAMAELERRRSHDGGTWNTTTHHRTTTVPLVAHCAGAGAQLSSVEDQLKQHRQMLRTRQTVRKMEDDSSKQSLESRYNVDWKTPLGEGSFGVVFLGVDRQSGERVAVKKISKKCTGLRQLQLEMRALLHLRASGGHPNICSLRENFSEDGYYYLILDLVQGCEMFDHLVAQGAYSEADAARLVREVASALAFLHGLGVTHCDLKPENLMLSSRNPSDAVIKLIDFGCSVVVDDDDDDDDLNVNDTVTNNLTGRTLAYCPPEVLDQSRHTMDPSVDMWALVRRVVAFGLP